jgi:hypothetical protein
MTTSDELSQALILYLGFETANTPAKDSTAVYRVFGEPRGSRLEAEVRSVLAEMDRLPVDWSTETLETVGELARSAMHALHPALSDSALDALAWRFTWSWR